MLDNYEITLVRVEGLGTLNKQKCKIYLNDQLVESLDLKDLETQQKVFIVPNKTTTRILVEDQATVASLRFNTKIIKCQGYHWLPLYTNPQDMIFEVPEEVGLPRVLLIIHSQKCLAPVIEITETSEVSENIEPAENQDFFNEDKNIELRMKLLELEHNLHFEKINNTQNLEKLQREFKATLDKTQFDLEKFKIASDKYKEKSNFLAEDLDSKIKKIHDLTEENLFLKSELDLYKSKYLDCLGSQEKLLSIVHAKEIEISKIKSSVKPLLAVSATNSISLPKKPLKQKLLKIPSENENPEITPNKSLSEQDSIDFYLQNSLSQLKLEGFFLKTSERYYKVGCKKVGVILRNGTIYCKFGETYKTLENFIYSHCNNELESFIKKRVNSRPSHRRVQSFSNTFDQTLAVNKSFKAENESSQKLIKTKSITPTEERKNKKKTLSIKLG